MDTAAVEVNNYGSLKVTTSMLIATLSQIAITRVFADNIPTSSSLIGKIINPSACTSTNGACEKLLDESMNSKDGKGPNFESINKDQQTTNLNEWIKWCCMNNYKCKMKTVVGYGNCMLHDICLSVLFQNPCQNHHILKQSLFEDASTLRKFITIF